MRAAVAGDRNRLFIRQRAGHRRAPQVFAIELAVHEAVDAIELGQRVARIDRGGGDELEQGFGVVRGDLPIGQRRAQRDRVTAQGQLAAFIDTQAFALDAVQALGEQGQVGMLAEQGQTAGEQVAQDCIPSRSGRPNMGVDAGLYKGGIADVGRLAKGVYVLATRADGFDGAATRDMGLRACSRSLYEAAATRQKRTSM